MKTDDTAVPGWRSATKRTNPIKLMYSPRSESRKDHSNSATAIYTIKITNVNEKPNLADAIRYVAENSPTDTVLSDVDGTSAPLVAVDDDLKVCPGPNPDATTGCTANACTSSCQKLTYSRVSHDPCFQGIGSASDPCLTIIDVDPCTGQLLVSNPLPGVNPVGLDYETKNTYTVVVQVTDDGSYPGPQDDQAVVTVYVLDVNEPPVVPTAVLSVDESSTFGTSLGFVAAFDPDSAVELHGQLTFTLGNAGNVLGLFSAEKSFYSVPDPTSSLCSTISNCWCRMRCPATGYTVRDTTTGKTCKNPTTGDQCDLGYCEGLPTPNLPTCPFATQSVQYGSGGANIKLASTTQQLDFETTARYDLTVIATDGGFIYGGPGTSVEITVIDTSLKDGWATYAIIPMLVDSTGKQLSESEAYALVAEQSGFESSTGIRNRPNLCASRSGGGGGQFCGHDHTYDLDYKPTKASATVYTITYTQPVSVRGIRIEQHSNGINCVSIRVGGVSKGEQCVEDPKKRGNSQYVEHAITDILGFPTSGTGSNTPPLSSSGSVVVNVRDVNEPPILADALGGSYAVAENKPVGYAIGEKLSATDPDAGQVITYTITSSIPASGTSVFKVESDGQLKVNGILDFETVPQYTLKVRATDSGTPALDSEDDATIVITLIDINEKPILEDQLFNIDENSPRDTLVNTPLTFVEPDAGQVHSFDITSGNSANMFAISSATGQIVVNQDRLLDFETTPSYSLTVRVQDSGDPKLSDTATVTISINDVNDAPSLSSYSPTLETAIGENVPLNRKTWLVGSAGITKQYCATDQDASDVLTFTILSGNDAGTFRVETDASNARCFFIMMDSTTPEDLNFEDPAKNMFSLIIQAKDNGVGTLATTIVATVTVENRNDPPILADSSISVPENAKASNPVGISIVALDEDGTADTLTYSIDAGTSNTCGSQHPVFSITSLNSIGSLAIHAGFNPGAATGPTRPAGELQSCPGDDAIITSFEVTVRVSDGAGGEASATYTISVTEQNDPPVFTDCATERSLTVVENADDGTLVGPVLSASDPDVGDTVSWNLLSQGNAGSAFSIVTSTGQLQVAAGYLINFESPSNPYLLTVEALDNEARTSGGATTRCAVRVTLIDVNENPVMDNSYSRSIDERSPSGVAVGLPITASDSDAGEAGTLLFSLSLPAPLEFVIESISGQISTSAALLDYEVKSSFAVQVQVSDSGTPSLSATSVVTISVIDINDPPVMPTMSVSMEEDATPGTVVLSSALLGTDEDSTDNTVANPLTYVMEAHSGATGITDLVDAEAKFEIYSSSGGAPVIRLKTVSTGLNYESTTSYSFNLRVSDDQVPTPASSSSPCVVRINNINELPLFTSICASDSAYAYCFNVEENADSGTNVGTQVAVTDPDVGQAHIYSIASSSPTASAFDIISSTGQIVVRSGSTRDLLDHESAGMYLLTIVSTDDGILEIGGGATTTSDPLTSLVAKIKITITDINENPTFPNAPASYPNRPSTFPEARWLTVDENVGNGIALDGVVQAQDPDDPTHVWGQLTYELLPSSSSGPFELSCDGSNCVRTTSSVSLRTLSTGVVSLDFELQATYSVTIQVSDGGDSPSPLTAQAQYQIAIFDLNEQPVSILF